MYTQDTKVVNIGLCDCAPADRAYLDQRGIEVSRGCGRDQAVQVTEQLESVELRRQLSQHIIDAYAQALVLTLRGRTTSKHNSLAFIANRHA